MKYALFDAGGLPLAFYAPEISGPKLIDGVPNPRIPAEAVEISDSQWSEFIENTGARRWDGTAVQIYEPPAPEPQVPEIISDRQFAQALALAGTITQAEALAWAARGELPQAMEDALDHIPDADGQRFGARMMLAAATTYERHHPLSEQLGGLLTNPATGKSYDAAALDALWTRAAAL
ncbi:hypothetical protein [Methylorubrum extorquens]